MTDILRENRNSFHGSRPSSLHAPPPAAPSSSLTDVDEGARRCSTRAVPRPVSTVSKQDMEATAGPERERHSLFRSNSKAKEEAVGAPPSPLAVPSTAPGILAASADAHKKKRGGKTSVKGRKLSDESPKLVRPKEGFVGLFEAKVFVHGRVLLTGSSLGPSPPPTPAVSLPLRHASRPCW